MLRLAGTFVALALAISLAGCSESSASRSGDTPPLFAAAASLRHVMPEAAAAFRGSGGSHVDFTFGATGDLVRQVEAGSPVDGVILAAAAPVDRLVADGLVRRETRRLIATNELVLIGRRGAPKLTFETLASLPAGERVAIGEPGAVPAGAYAKQALEALGNWDAVHPHLVFGGDVAGVLAFARRGEVAAAVVYRSEMTAIHDVILLDTADGPWAPQPEVVAGLTGAGDNAAAAAAFLAFLESDAGRALLRARGFGLP